MSSRSWEDIINDHVISSDAGVLSLVADVLGRAAANAGQLRDEVAEAQAVASSKLTGVTAQLASVTLEMVRRGIDRCAGDCGSLSTDCRRISELVTATINKLPVTPPYLHSQRECKRGTVVHWDCMSTTADEIRNRQALFRMRGYPDPIDRDAFRPGRHDGNLTIGEMTRSTVDPFATAWFYLADEPGARRLGDRLLTELNELYLRMPEFTVLSLPEIDQADNEDEPAAADPATLPSVDTRSAPYVTPPVAVGNLPVPEGGGGQGDAGAGGPGSADGEGGGDFLDEYPDRPFDPDPDGSDHPGFGTAAADGGGSPPGPPFQSDGTGRAFAAGLGARGGAGGAGTGLAGGFLPGMMPIGGGVPPTGLAGAGPGQTGAGSKLVELDKKRLFEPADLAPPGVISSPPRPVIDDETHFA